MNRGRWIGLGLIVIAMIGLGWWFNSRRNRAATAQATERTAPETATVRRGDRSIAVEATGKVEPITQVEVKSKASGQIVTLPVVEGQSVAEGDLIAKLDPVDVKAAYDQTAADLDVAVATQKQAQTTYDRQKGLFDQKLVAEVELETARLGLVQARAQLVRARTAKDQASVRLRETTVRAPSAGIVLSRPVEVGQIIASGTNSVSGGTVIATLADLRKVNVNTDVDEVDIGRVVVGQDARVIADAYPGRTFRGKVVRIAPMAKVEQNVTTFPVVIEVDNEDLTLKAGMNASVTLSIADRRDVLLVPNDAVLTMQQLAATRGGSGRRGGGARRGGAAAGGGNGWEGRGGGAGARSGGRGGEPAATGASGDSLRNRRGAWMQAWTAMGADESARRLVRVQAAGGAVELRPVAVGLSDFESTEVTAGLKEGDVVVIEREASRVLAESQQFQERIRSRAGSGFGGSSNGSSSGGTGGAAARRGN